MSAVPEMSAAEERDALALLLDEALEREVAAEHAMQAVHHEWLSDEELDLVERAASGRFVVGSAGVRALIAEVRWKRKFARGL